MSKYTRVTNRAATCIDNIVTSLKRTKYKTIVCDPHFSYRYRKNVKKENIVSSPPTIMRRKVNSKNLIRFRNRVPEIEWVNISTIKM